MLKKRSLQGLPPFVYGGKGPAVDKAPSFNNNIGQNLSDRLLKAAFEDTK